ncbi:MAG: molybdenum cofactor guanylyltransferase [Archaeoglobaceae archaeon]|nr:molybdenum cofactor guanylyltransferase [Archaeoglobaceae archaeon]MDW8118459.1 molybdenum cofactor guanylyltransferase [Archaeoglobaceae archaeon]
MKLAVLMGGKGRRVGMEKAEIKICGRKLIEIAIEKYSDYDLIFVCRDRSQMEKYSKEFGIKCVCDFYQDFGALAGIHSALKNNGDTAIVAIDMPFVKKEILEFIYDLGKKSNCDALIPKHEYAEPLIAYYSANAIPEIEKSIKNGEKSILIPLSRLRTIFYPAEELRKFDKSLRSFFNINTPEDIKKAEEICSQILSGEL